MLTSCPRLTEPDTIGSPNYSLFDQRSKCRVTHNSRLFLPNQYFLVAHAKELTLREAEPPANLGILI
jgi:hypothetical protein